MAADAGIALPGKEETPELPWPYEKLDVEKTRKLAHQGCPISVARWCKISGYYGGTPEVYERCSRLCGDVAARAVELLNTLKDGSFTASYTPRTETTGCTSCHAKGNDAAKRPIAGGKQNCLDCHKPHK